MRELFSNAIIQLTLLYVGVLTLVCLLFSGFIYTLASNEIDRTSRQQVVGFRNLLGRFIVDEEESELLRDREANEAQSRLRAKLLFGNLSVIAGGSVLSYFFAKRTLRPIEEGVRAQERFTSDASHELRTPLAAMRTELEVALRSKEIDKVYARELITSTLEEVGNLQTITENLLALARNKELTVEESIHVTELVKQLAKEYEPTFKDAGQALKIKSQNGVKAHTNPDAIKQLISILLDNSLKYAGKRATTTLSLRHDSERIYISVSDNGSGIAPEHLEHIFERFYKIDSSRTNSKVQGHGLGLSIAKQLVDALGGEISAKSGPKNTGVEFLIELPIAVE